MKYTDKTVIITGGAKGIGEGCVRVFAVAGANVVLADCDEPNGRRVAAEAGQAGPGKAVFINCDVTKTDDIRRLIDETIVRFGRLDCLINNAGRHPPHLPIDEFSAEDFRGLLEVNLVSVFTACKFALPHLRRTEGNIINLASLVATTGQHHATTYVATKGAVLALTKALAIDEAIHNVRVNSVSPGNIYTPLWQEAIDAAPDPAQFRADGEAAQLMGRMGTPEEAGKLCLFIAAEATFQTGVDFILSGGAELGYGRKSRKES
ncbi:MAG TPA: SDR family oxidoreductase [Blastocatellia bacterium]|nr:SDR family oxidoreductase [Blastocatellia bacterium]